MPRKSSSTTTPKNGKAAKPKTAKAAAPRSKAAAGKTPARKRRRDRRRGGYGPALVIVESPKKAKSINKFLGSKFIVKASMGHVRDLPKRKLGLDVADGYAASYEIVPAKKDTIGDLRRDAARSEIVYLATDPDREGEAIAWHLQQALDLPDERVRRVTFHEITERAVREAFDKVGPINMDMVNAQQARRFLDRFVGYQLSPLLWSKVRPQPERRAGAVGGRPADRRPRDGRSGRSSRRSSGRSPPRQPGRLDPGERAVRGRPDRVRGRQVRRQDRGRGPEDPRRAGLRHVRRLQGGRDREARQGRPAVQDEHAPAAGRHPPAVPGQEDDEGRPGAL